MMNRRWFLIGSAATIAAAALVAPAVAVLVPRKYVLLPAQKPYYMRRVAELMFAPRDCAAMLELWRSEGESPELRSGCGRGGIVFWRGGLEYSIGLLEKDYLRIEVDPIGGGSLDGSVVDLLVYDKDTPDGEWVGYVEEHVAGKPVTLTRLEA